MEKNERVFLIAVLVCALLFSALSLGNAREYFARRAAGAVEPGIAGQARDADIAQIKGMIRRQYLSDHEAEFYTTMPVLQSPRLW